MTRFQIYHETEFACKYKNPLYKAQYSEILVEYDEGFDMTTGKIKVDPYATHHLLNEDTSYIPVNLHKSAEIPGERLEPYDSESTRLQTLSLMNSTYFGAIPYDIHLHMKLDYTISRMFQGLGLGLALELGLGLGLGLLVVYDHPLHKGTSYIPVNFQKSNGQPGGKLKPHDTRSTRLQELSLMNNTFFGNIHYDIYLDMKLDYTISRTFQEMSLSELETLHQLCELERTQILQSLALAVLKIPYAVYLLSGNRSNFLDYDGNILWFHTCTKKVSPLYVFEDKRCYKRIPIFYKNKVHFVDTFPRRTYFWDTAVPCGSKNSQNVVQLKPDEEKYYLLTPYPTLMQPLKKVLTRKHSSYCSQPKYQFTINRYIF